MESPSERDCVECEPLLVDDFETLYHNISTLRDLASGIAHFHEDSLKTRAERSVDAFETIRATLDSLELLCREIAPYAKLYDFSEDVRGNGYRSLLKICDRCVTRLVRLARKCWKNKKNKIFTAAATLNDVASFAEVLCGLKKLLNLAVVMAECSDTANQNVFPDEDKLPLETINRMETMSRTEFYGSCLGFQYASSMRPLLRTVNIAMAAYGEGYRKYNKEGGDGTSLRVTAASLANSFKYMANPRKRAEMVVDLTADCDVNFAKAFWSLTERSLMKHFPKLVSSSVAINNSFSLPAEPVYLPSVKTEGGEVMIQAPLNEAAEPQRVQVRLLLYRDDQSKFSDKLLIHYHGGGFVAQSSKSHEVYLRNWARDLSVPILSVDYSLAPEFPFPRGLDDAFFAYAWALANPSCLHTTARRVCITGDSAGGNFTVGVTLKAIEAGIRIPDGIVPVYGAYLVRYSLSPSRLLSVMDPFLLRGILVKCLAAYVGKEPDEKTDSVDSDAVLNSLFTSSVDASDAIDGLLDDLPSSPRRHGDTNGDIRKCKSEPAIRKLNDDDDVDEDDDETSLCSNDSFVVFKRPDVDETKMGEANQDENATATSAFVHPMDDHRSREFRLGHFVEEKWSQVKSFFTRRATSTTTSREPHDGDGEKGKANKDTNKAKKGVCSKETLFTGKHPPLTSDPFVSPYFADDAVLARFPPTHLVAAHLDPLLDDSVAFARRLRAAGAPVSLHLIDNVPHGFLSCSMGKEAKRGAETCLRLIARVLKHKQRRSRKVAGMADLLESVNESGSSSVDAVETSVDSEDRNE